MALYLLTDTVICHLEITFGILQMDLGSVKRVNSIITQGRPDWDNDYAQTYQIQYCYDDDDTKWCSTDQWATYPKVSSWGSCGGMK